MKAFLDKMMDTVILSTALSAITSRVVVNRRNRHSTCIVQA